MSANSVIIKLALQDELTPELKQAQKELEALATNTLKLEKNLASLKSDKRSLISGDIKSEVKEIKDLQDEVKKLEKQRDKAKSAPAKKEAKGQLGKAKIALTRAVNTEINKQNALLKEQRAEVDLLAAKTQKKITNELRQRKGATAAIKQETAAVKANTASRYKEDAVRSSASNTLVRHIRRLESMAVAYYALTRAYSSTIGAGVELNRQYQNLELGLAALLSAQTKGVKESGKQVTAIEKFRRAQELTKNTLDKIKKASLETPATFQQMAGFYQQAIGVALSSNKAFGSSIEETSDNVILFTKRMSSLASTIGLDMARVDEEVRSLINANASTDSILSSIIFGSPAQANEAVRKAKQKVGGLTELLNKALSQFDVLFKQSSYDKEKNYLTQELDDIRKAAAAPVFEDLRKAMRDMTAYLKENKAEIIDSFKTVYNVIKAVANQADTLLVAFLAWKVIPAVSLKPLAIGIGLISRGAAGATVAMYGLRTAITRVGASLALLSRRFLPLLALEGFYQAYLYFTDQQIDKEKKLADVTNATALAMRKKELFYKQAKLRQDYGLYEQDTKTLSNRSSSNRRAYNIAKSRMDAYKQESAEISKQIALLFKKKNANDEAKKQAEEKIALLQKDAEQLKLRQKLEEDYFNLTSNSYEKLTREREKLIEKAQGDRKALALIDKLYNAKLDKLNEETLLSYKSATDDKVDIATQYNEQLFNLRASDLEKVDKWLDDELKKVKDNEKAKHAIYLIYAHKRQNIVYGGGNNKASNNKVDDKYINQINAQADREIAQADKAKSGKFTALENSLAQSINRGIQDALNQQFDFTAFIVQMSSAVGAAIVSQEAAKAVRKLFANVGAAGTQSGNPYAAAAGATLMAFGALYNSRDPSAYNQEQQNRIQNELQAMNDKLSTQIQIMEKGGLKGTALFNELSKAVQTFELNTRVYEEKSFRTGYDQLFNKPTYTKKQLQDTGAALLDFGAVVVDLSDEIESVTNSFKDLYDDVTGSTFFKDQNVANAKSTLQNAGFNTDAFATSLFNTIKKLNNTTYSKSDLTRIFTTGSQAEQQQVLDSYRAIFGDQSTKENILNLADAIQIFGGSLTSTTNNIESAVTSVSGINDSIQGVLDDINNFGASGVQSAQFYAQRYSDQLAATKSALSAYQASGSDADLEAYNTSVSDLTSVASNYKEAIAATYKSSAVTQNVLQTITGDLKPLQDATVSLQERMLDELKQINVATTSTAEEPLINYVVNTVITPTSITPQPRIAPSPTGVVGTTNKAFYDISTATTKAANDTANAVNKAGDDISREVTNLFNGGLGFRSGGFTPNVGINTIAGVVHGGEYVAPAYQVQSNPTLFKQLDAQRKGYKGGGIVDNSEMLNVMKMMLSYLRQIADKDSSVNVDIDSIAQAIQRHEGLSA